MAEKTRRPAKRLSDRFAGAVQGLSSRGLEGWAWNASDPKAHVPVKVCVNGTPVGTFLADRTDPPLPVDGLAPPGHAFQVQLNDKPAGAGFPSVLEVYAGQASVPIGTLTIKTPEQFARILKSYRVGHVDAIEQGQLVGWAVDVKSPASRQMVDLFDNGNFVAQTECSGFRADVRSKGIGDGYCGFSFALPAAVLDGKVHALSVRFPEGGAELEGGPVLFGPSAYSAVVHLLTQLQGVVSRMEAQLQSVATPSGDVYQQIERALLARHEALLDIHRESAEREISLIRRLLQGEQLAAQAASVRVRRDVVSAPARTIGRAPPRSRKK